MKKLVLFAFGVASAALAIGQTSVGAYTTLEEPLGNRDLCREDTIEGVKG